MVIWFNTCGQDYDTSTIAQNWSGVGGCSVVPDGTYGYHLEYINGGGSYESLPSMTAGIINVTFSFNTNHGTNTYVYFAGMTMQQSGTNTLQIMNSGNLILETAPMTNPSAYHCIEVKFDLSAHSMIVREDGIVIGSGAGLSHMPLPAASNYGINCQGTPSPLLAVYTVQDLTGPAPFNDMVGELKPFCLFPTGAGLDTQWSNSFSANNYAQVNDRVAPGDASYLTSDIVGNIDLYTVGAIPADTVSIAACMGRINGKKFVGGTRNVAFALYPGSGSPTLGPDNGIASGQYLEYDSVFGVNPITGVNWVISDFTALQIGMKVTS